MTPCRWFSFLILPVVLGAAAPQAQAAPAVLSVYPLGGQRGTTVDVELRGSGLNGAFAVWLGGGSRVESAKASASAKADVKITKGPNGLEARVQAIEGGSRAKVRLAIAPDARVGFHALSLISQAGLSGTVLFWVGPHAVIRETDAPHHTPDTAQPVVLPVAVNGRVSAGGQLDYYAFEIVREQTVAFEVVALHGNDFEPQFALYEAAGSYLDPNRSRRLLFDEEITQGSMPASRRMTYHFTKPGRYLVQLATRFAQGGGDFSYLLRVAAPEPPAAGENALAWARRRLRDFGVRALAAPAANVAVVTEVEPNHDPGQLKALEVPAVLEGVIGKPGDIDHFRFKAKAGELLAFDIHTPRATRPHFNPRLDVVDAKGKVVLSNLHAQEGKVGTETGKVIQVGADLVGKLEQAGEYSLRVRDLTTIQGGPDHAYWVLVRPQIPHIGAVEMKPPGPVNLVPGAKQRVTLTAPPKEGFAGTLALSVEGLPQGVKAFVATNNSVVELFAEASAPLTATPGLLRISGVCLDGKTSSPAFPVTEIPIMVVKK